MKAKNLKQHLIKRNKLSVASKGYIKHELLKCMEAADKYLLIVQWQTLEDHTEGFRKSKTYNEWKSLLHHFYEPFPTVEHYKTNFKRIFKQNYDDHNKTLSPLRANRNSP